MDWQRLNRDKSKEIIETISKVSDAGLFNPMSSEVECAPLPFYGNMLLYRLTNYASLPSFRMEYLGNGSNFFLLDGTADTIYSVNSRANFSLNNKTVLPYLRFFLDNVNVESGDVFLVEDLNSLEFMESLDSAQKEHIQHNFHDIQVQYDPSLSSFMVKCTLYFMGILMHTTVKVDEDGIVSILDQTMLMQAGMQAGLTQ